MFYQFASKARRFLRSIKDAIFKNGLKCNSNFSFFVTLTTLELISTFLFKSKKAGDIRLFPMDGFPLIEHIYIFLIIMRKTDVTVSVTQLASAFGYIKHDCGTDDRHLELNLSFIRVFLHFLFLCWRTDRVYKLFTPSNRDNQEQREILVDSVL